MRTSLVARAEVVCNARRNTVSASRILPSSNKMTPALNAASTLSGARMSARFRNVNADSASFVCESTMPCQNKTCTSVDANATAGVLWLSAAPHWPNLECARVYSLSTRTSFSPSSATGGRMFRASAGAPLSIKSPADESRKSRSSGNCRSNALAHCALSTGLPIVCASSPATRNRGG